VYITLPHENKAVLSYSYANDMHSWSIQWCVHYTISLFENICRLFQIDVIYSWVFPILNARSIKAERIPALPEGPDNFSKNPEPHNDIRLFVPTLNFDGFHLSSASCGVMLLLILARLFRKGTRRTRLSFVSLLRITNCATLFRPIARYDLFHLQH
jgi:hypothetical protein